jgi:hypothetical protein
LDAFVVGALGALAAVFGLLTWLLWTHPELVFGGGGDLAGDDDWGRSHPAALRWLRWIAGGGTFLLGFLTGLAAAFLAGTG